MGGSSVSLSQKAEAWRKKADALRVQAQNTSLTPGSHPLDPAGRTSGWVSTTTMDTTSREDLDGYN